MFGLARVSIVRSMGCLLACQALLVGKISYASSGGTTQSTQYSVGDLDKTLNWVTESLSGSKAGCVADVYREQVGMQAYGETSKFAGTNLGANELSDRILQSSPCLATLARAFYSEIRKTDKESAGFQRPGINDVVGRGRYSGLQTGWLWEKALEMSKGNSQLAMQLIGFCLHDDMPLGRSIKIFDLESDRPELEASLKSVSEELNRLKSSLKKDGVKNDERTELDRQIKSYESKRRTLKTRIEKLGQSRSGPFDSVLQCPGRSSAAFVPKSLSIDADLSDPMKRLVSDVQSASGAGPQPAKYYHVYMGAKIGCKLAACGLDEKVGGFFQDKVTAAYRGFRLCSLIEYAKSRRENAEKELGFSLGENEKVRKMMADLEKAKTVNDIPVKTYDAFFSGEPLAPDAFRKHVEAEISIFDGADLYIKSKSPNVANIPCSFMFYGGPRIDPKTEAVERSMLNKLFSTNGCAEPGWDMERCDKAVKRLRTWEVDEYWTRAQQVKGLRFGINACKGKGFSTAELEVLACNAIKSSDSNDASRKSHAEKAIR